MITALIALSMIYVFGKLFLFGLKAAWGITKFVTICLFLPLILVVLTVIGVGYLVLPALFIAGAVFVVKSIVNYVNA